ncbi:GIN domain-containing protein [Flavitalea flava]
MIEVKGDGNIVSKVFPVSSFLRLHLSGKGLIELHQSEEEKVIVETDANLLEYFEIVNSGRTLYVTTEGKFKKPVCTSCKIQVFLRQIDVLYVRNDGADVVCPSPVSLASPIEIKIQSIGNTELDLIAPAIKILCASVGNVLIKGKCSFITIKNQSEGNFNSIDLEADDLSILNRAEGNVDLYAAKNISISHYGEGYIHYSGDAVLNDVKQYGDGEIKYVSAGKVIA